MPNWAEGVLKIRGTKQQIVDYLEEYLKAVDWLGITTFDLNTTISDFGIVIEPDPTSYQIDEDRKNFLANRKPVPSHFWFKGSQRAFIENTKLDFDFWTDDPEEEIIITLNDFKQAWSINANDFVDGSKKHGIDIKIFGYELGMQFTQEIEIVKGEITIDKNTTYDSYDWEVQFNGLGG